MQKGKPTGILFFEILYDKYFKHVAFVSVFEQHSPF